VRKATSAGLAVNEPLSADNIRRKSSAKSLSMSDSLASSQADCSEPPRANPYLILSQEEYTEHKSHILHCKFSKDGKHIASVDAQGVIKSNSLIIQSQINSVKIIIFYFIVWSIDNTTLNTLMQKSVIISIEWDKRSHRILYLGTQTALVKLYDITQKRIVQEVAFSKAYPIVTSICTSESISRLLVMSTSKPSKPGDAPRSGQMAVCNTNGSAASGSVVIEKVVELDLFFCQCSFVYSENTFILGK